MGKLGSIILALILGIFVVAVIVGLVSAIPTYFLWNALMPDIFGLNHISFLQAWGLCWLCSVLFKTTVTGNTNS